MSDASSSRIVWLAREILPHEPELRRWLRTRLTDADVDDVVQESYAIVAGMESVGHILTPRNYLFTVAKSVMLKGLRKARMVELDQFAEIDGLQIPCDRPGPETIAADRQELSRLAKQIEALPPKCRQAFILRKVHGLSQRDVAAKMAISENTVEKHMAKAMMLLAVAIGRGGNRAPETSSRDERYGQPAWSDVTGISTKRH